jgi:hypothetical protein
VELAIIGYCAVWAMLSSQLFKKQCCMTNIVWNRSFDPPSQNTIMVVIGNEKVTQ